MRVPRATTTRVPDGSRRHGRGLRPGGDPAVKDGVTVAARPSVGSNRFLLAPGVASAAPCGRVAGLPRAVRGRGDRGTVRRWDVGVKPQTTRCSGCSVHRIATCCYPGISWCVRPRGRIHPRPGAVRPHGFGARPHGFGARPQSRGGLSTAPGAVAHRTGVLCCAVQRRSNGGPAAVPRQSRGSPAAVPRRSCGCVPGLFSGRRSHSLARRVLTGWHEPQLGKHSWRE